MEYGQPKERRKPPEPLFPCVVLAVFGMALLWLCYNYMFLPWASSDSIPSMIEHPLSLHERLHRSRRG
jgi:hypothetical protein